MNIVSIIPRQREDAGPTITNGTEVRLADGTKLEGVTRIELIAETNSVWRARIDVLIAPPKLEGVLAQIAVNSFDDKGERVDITNIEDDTLRYNAGSSERTQEQLAAQVRRMTASARGRAR